MAAAEPRAAAWAGAAGADSLLRTKLTLAECATGVTKTITVDTAILCDGCTGSGTHGDSQPVRCEDVWRRRRGPVRAALVPGQVMTSRPCPTCRGVGETIRIRATSAVETAASAPAATSP